MQWFSNNSMIIAHVDHDQAPNWQTSIDCALMTDQWVDSIYLVIVVNKRVDEVFRFLCWYAVRYRLFANIFSLKRSKSEWKNSRQTKQKKSLSFVSRQFAYRHFGLSTFSYVDILSCRQSAFRQLFFDNLPSTFFSTFYPFNVM